MIELILKPGVATGLLAALAVITPIGAWLLCRKFPSRVPLRFAMVGGAFGPFALALWGFHNLVLKIVGFDSIFSVIIVWGVAIAAGAAAGIWAAKEA